jgi:hypothetical protein
MGTERVSKYIEFTIDSNETLEDLMGEKGTVVGRGTVSTYWEDSMITEEFSEYLALEWVSDTGNKQILVGDDLDVVWDEIFDNIRKEELMLIEDSTEADLSDYQTKSIKEMLMPKVTNDVVNMYKCECGEEWRDVWDCGCNDKCPSCNTEITPYASIPVDEVGTGSVIPDWVLLKAHEFVEMSVERDNLNEKEDWDGAFEVECSQRDAGMEIAQWIIENYKGGE